jgi:shikimate dehydrogenase
MITGKTSLVGIIGDPVEHSLSPPMHNAAFRHLRMNYVYVPFHVLKDNLSIAVEGAKALGMKGLNVTIPHKTEVVKYLDELEKAAELIGAVNTIKFDKKISKGFNTDGLGAVKAIEEIISLKGKKIVILGAGGASRAICFQLLLSGVKNILIVNRTLENAYQLKADLLRYFSAEVSCLKLDEKLEDELIDADVLINTTPVGMHPHEHQKPIVNKEMIHQGLLVNDIVYNPLKTGLLREAEKAGAMTISGVRMLIYQGVEAFRIWTGIEPPLEVFEMALMRELGYEDIQ